MIAIPTHGRRRIKSVAHGEALGVLIGNAGDCGSVVGAGRRGCRMGDAGLSTYMARGLDRGARATPCVLLTLTLSLAGAMSQVVVGGADDLWIGFVISVMKVSVGIEISCV